MSGYQDCACRDCFDIAIGNGKPTLCYECDAAGCAVYPFPNLGYVGMILECQREDAYGVDGLEDNAEDSDV